MTRAIVFLLLFGIPAFGSDINACKYLLVTDFTSDPFGIAEELRAQGRAKGFTVVRSLTEVPAGDNLKSCVMTGSWSSYGLGAAKRVSISVIDPASNELIAEATAGERAYWTVSAAARTAVEKMYAKLGYTGFDEEVYRKRLERVYPTRPKVVITEAEIKANEPRSPVEGIWSDPQDKYRLGIVPTPKGANIDADFVAVVLRSGSPVWQSGEIKAEIRSTASSDIFTCTYFMENKRPVGATVTLDAKSVLKGSFKTAAGADFDLVLLRVWPKGADTTSTPVASNTAVTGTGFLVTRTGLIATNWHVVADRGHIQIIFPGWKVHVAATVVIKDSTNDLAVLRLSDLSRLADTCSEFPYQLASSNHVALGEQVSTIGYPLQPLLGSTPKFSGGVVASKTGLQDDPRMFQISAQVQPGSSGSPLFNSKGDVVGVVVATLDAAYLYRTEGALPQNVNWAIKSDYLLNIFGMIPSESPAVRTSDFSPEKAANCVGIISAW